MIKKPILKIQNHGIFITSLEVQPSNSLAFASAAAFLASSSSAFVATISLSLGVRMKNVMIKPITNNAAAKIKNGAIDSR